MHFGQFIVNLNTVLKIRVLSRTSNLYIILIVGSFSWYWFWHSLTIQNIRIILLLFGSIWYIFHINEMRWLSRFTIQKSINCWNRENLKIRFEKKSELLRMSCNYRFLHFYIATFPSNFPKYFALQNIEIFRKNPNTQKKLTNYVSCDVYGQEVSIASFQNKR